MNQVQLIGNITKDPEIRYTKTGKSVASFTVAVSRSYTPQGSSEQKELTDFLPCVAWGNLAERVGNNLGKGSHVVVHGRMQVRSYETAEGQKRYVTEVVCSFVGMALKDDAPKGTDFDKVGKEVDEDIPF